MGPRKYLWYLDLQSGSVLQSLRSELQLRESERRHAIPGIVSESSTGDAESQLRRLRDGRVEAVPRPDAEPWPALRPANRHLGRVGQAVRLPPAASVREFSVARRQKQFRAPCGSGLEHREQRKINGSDWVRCRLYKCHEHCGPHGGKLP